MGGHASCLNPSFPFFVIPMGIAGDDSTSTQVGLIPRLDFFYKERKKNLARQFLDWRERKKKFPFCHRQLEICETYLSLHLDSGTLGLNLFFHEFTARQGHDDCDLNTELSSRISDCQTGITTGGADQVSVGSMFFDGLLAHVAYTSTIAKERKGRDVSYKHPSQQKLDACS